MFATIISALTFLSEHADLFELVANALKGGVTEDAIKKAISDAMVISSDEAVKEELATIANAKAASVK